MWSRRFGADLRHGPHEALQNFERAQRRLHPRRKQSTKAHARSDHSRADNCSSVAVHKQQRELTGIANGWGPDLRVEPQFVQRERALNRLVLQLRYQDHVPAVRPPLSYLREACGCGYERSSTSLKRALSAAVRQRLDGRATGLCFGGVEPA